MSNKVFRISLVVGAIFIGIILADPDKNQAPAIPESAIVDASTEASRCDYFASHGWDVRELSEKEIVIPFDFSGEYENYAALQDKQGMPLREYAGKSAKLYVYEVQNYSPNENRMLAELLVCEDTAIASLVYSEDGGSLRLAVR